MQISEKRFVEFKELMRKKVGKKRYSKMTEQELLASATALITLMNAIYKPITKADYEKYTKEVIKIRLAKGLSISDLQNKTPGVVSPR